MDSLIGLFITLGVGAVGGIITGIDKYRDKKSKRKLKKRVEALEREKQNQDAINEPIETPSEAGYAKPEGAQNLYV